MKNVIPKLGLFCCAAAFVMLPSVSANARPGWPSSIPNGDEFGCGACHISAGGAGPRTLFGETVKDTLNGGQVDWSAVYSIDADDDGQTNGQELGDPCGTWTVGSTNLRDTDISNPSDEQDASSDADSPACDAPADDAGTSEPSTSEPSTGEPEAGTDPVGPCSCTEPSSSKTPWAGLFAIVGIFFIRRKRA